MVGLHDLSIYIDTIVGKFGQLPGALLEVYLHILLKKWRPSWIFTVNMDFDQDENYRNENFSLNSI